jgi:hypothetical protein
LVVRSARASEEKMTPGISKGKMRMIMQEMESIVS